MLLSSTKLLINKIMADNMMSKTLVVLYAASLPLYDLNPITIYKIPMIRNTVPNNKKGKYQNINDLSARFDDSNSVTI